MVSKKMATLAAGALMIASLGGSAQAATQGARSLSIGAAGLAEGGESGGLTGPKIGIIAGISFAVIAVLVIAFAANDDEDDDAPDSP